MNNAQRVIIVSINSTTPGTYTASYTYITQAGIAEINSATCDTSCAVMTDFHYVFDGAALAEGWTFSGITQIPPILQTLEPVLGAGNYSLHVFDMCTVAGACNYTINCLLGGTPHQFDPETQNDPTN